MNLVNRRRFVVLTAAMVAWPLTKSIGGSETVIIGNKTKVSLEAAKHLERIGLGWRPIVTATLQKMRAIDPDFEILQIKQKLGGLRLYYRSERRDALARIVTAAEHLCGQSCEECGHPASIFNDSGWIRTLCLQCSRMRTKA